MANNDDLKNESIVERDPQSVAERDREVPETYPGSGGGAGTSVGGSGMQDGAFFEHDGADGTRG